MAVRLIRAVMIATVSTATYLANNNPNRGTGAATRISSVPRSRSPAVRSMAGIDRAGDRHQDQDERHQGGQRNRAVAAPRRFPGPRDPIFSTATFRAAAAAWQLRFQEVEVAGGQSSD